LEVLLPAKHQPEMKRWAILFFASGILILYFTIAKISAAAIRRLGRIAVSRVFCPAAIDIVTISPAGFQKGFKAHYSR
jgi:hypothetical protein